MRVRTRALGGGLIFVFWLLNLTRSHPFPVQTATDLNYAASGVEHSGNPRKGGRARQCALDNTRVRNLCGMVVENRDGQTLGKLEDFIVDMPSGQVTYAQISSGGLFG